MKIINWKIVLVFLSGFIAQGCYDEKAEEKISAENFPDMLDLKGIPEAPDDRSVFIFSDMGAWHGYSLPPDDDQNYSGSFIGPYLMTQDNGIWLSECLSQLKIEQGGTTIFPGNHKTIKNESFPHKLHQTIEIENSNLHIETELIFISGRSSLVKLSVFNHSQKETVQNLSWSGDLFSGLADFEQSENGVIIKFQKNDNTGQIRFTGLPEVSLNQAKSHYSATYKNLKIPANGSANFYQTQTFYFSMAGFEKENVLIDQALQHPDHFFSKNLSTWNSKINKVLDQLNPIYKAEADQRVAIKCLQTLNTNWRSTAGLLKHDGLFPSYNYKWFNGFWAWDSWKHAVAITLYDPELAKNQIRAMYDYQDEFGMIADCIYRDTVLEQINWRNSKPPLSAWAVWEVYQASGDDDFLKEMFPKIEKYHNWWYQFRDQNKNGICEYGSTDGTLVAAKWESGMDNAVRFDGAEILGDETTGYTLNQESVDLNSFLCFEKQILAKMASLLEFADQASEYLQDAADLKITIREKFYDEDFDWFFDIDIKTGEPIQVLGSEGWVPIWTEIASPSQVDEMMGNILNPEIFSTYIPFLTLTADHPEFRPKDGYWRGPVWLDQVYFAVSGLQKYDRDVDAVNFTNQLFDRLEGLKNSDLPIRENYNPLTGKGLEASHFSWSAAHILLLMSEND